LLLLLALWFWLVQTLGLVGLTRLATRWLWLFRLGSILLRLLPVPTRFISFRLRCFLVSSCSICLPFLDWLFRFFVGGRLIGFLTLSVLVALLLAFVGLALPLPRSLALFAVAVVFALCRGQLLLTLTRVLRPELLSERIGEPTECNVLLARYLDNSVQL
jgi:hypothetical protein